MTYPFWKYKTGERNKRKPVWNIYRRISHNPRPVEFERLLVTSGKNIYNLEYLPQEDDHDIRFVKNSDLLKLQKGKYWKEGIRDEILNYIFPTLTIYCHYQIFCKIAGKTPPSGSYHDFLIFEKKKNGDYKRHYLSNANGAIWKNDNYRRFMSSRLKNGEILTTINDYEKDVSQWR